MSSILFSCVSVKAKFKLHFLYHFRQSSQDSANEVAVLNGAPLRRPSTLVSSTDHGKPYGNTIELTIHKDSSGYGMKVSGDNPVFVESVKPALAAQRAGLMAGDMILKVNGTPVRYSSHVEVVKLIKASEIVNLTIQRSQTHQQQHHMSQRPMSTSITNSPSTPVAQRSSITAPLPVDVSYELIKQCKFLTIFLIACKTERNGILKNANAPSHVG